MRAIKEAGRRRRRLIQDPSLHETYSSEERRGENVSELRGDALTEMAERALAEDDLLTATALFDLAELETEDRDRCSGGRWIAHMLRGDYEAAWRECDAIRHRGLPDPDRLWDGNELWGSRLILRCLHGYGDAIQMFRFIPQLRKKVDELTVQVPPRLVELASNLDDIDHVIACGASASLAQHTWDREMEILELPYALRVTSEDLGPQQGYLRFPFELFERVRKIVGVTTLPRVGLVWCAGEWDRPRSMTLEILRPLLQIAQVEFWTLQGEPGRQEMLTHDCGGAICRDVYECGDGINNLAATIKHMDLVISVDTLAAHLAGALGVPCWLLLQRRVDWRWTATGEASPWYRSLKLWRQQSGDTWPSLICRVRHALEKWAQEQRNYPKVSSGFSRLDRN